MSKESGDRIIVTCKPEKGFLRGFRTRKAVDLDLDNLSPGLNLVACSSFSPEKGSLRLPVDNKRLLIEVNSNGYLSGDVVVPVDDCQGCAHREKGRKLISSWEYDYPDDPMNP